MWAFDGVMATSAFSSYTTSQERHTLYTVELEPGQVAVIQAPPALSFPALPLEYEARGPEEHDEPWDGRVQWLAVDAEGFGGYTATVDAFEHHAFDPRWVLLWILPATRRAQLLETAVTGERF